MTTTSERAPGQGPDRAPDADDPRLRAAWAAAADAHRDTARLVRLLSVLSERLSPTDLLPRALEVLAETHAADVVALVRPTDGRWTVTAQVGLPERAAPRVLDLGDDAHRALRLGAAASWSTPGPPVLVAPRTPVRAAAAVPLREGDDGSPVLLLLRREEHPFSSSDLQLATGVAGRLRDAIDDGAHRASTEAAALAGQRLARHLEVDPLLREVAAATLSVTAADAAVVVVVEGGRAEVAVTAGALSPSGAPRADVVGRRSPVQDLPGWGLLEGGGAVVLQDLALLPDAPPAALALGVRGVLGVPVVDDGQLVAVLYAVTRTPGAIPGGAAEGARLLAGYVAASLVNARLYRALATSETVQRELSTRLHHQATHDPLTGLANRELAHRALVGALAADRPGGVGLLFCDLDDFKGVNDHLGHAAGDELLQQVAARLQENLRSSDLIARFGGDEFVVVLEGAPDLDAVTAAGDRVLHVLGEAFWVAGRALRVRASVGGVHGARSSAAEAALRASALLRDADAAMYEAKASGRGRVAVFDDAAAQRAVAHLALRQDLQHALDRGELAVAYQPVVDPASSRVRSFEALLRWTSPVHGRVPPDTFVPLAEETGAIAAMGVWVLRQALGQLAQWRRLPGRADLTVAVNVSPAQLRTRELTEAVVEALAEQGLPPSALLLEVTETLEVGEEHRAVLRELAAMGCRVAVDDFGVSYSNLDALRRTPADVVKIDRSFVSGLTAASDDGDRARALDRGVVRAVLAIAQEVGLAVVAEGVETEEERAALVALGCPLAQGYLFGAPAPAGDCTRALTDC